MSAPMNECSNVRGVAGITTVMATVDRATTTIVWCGTTSENMWQVMWGENRFDIVKWGLLVSEAEITMNTSHQFHKIYTLVPTSPVSISTSLRTGVYGSGVGVSICSALDLAASHIWML